MVLYKMNEEVEKLVDMINTMEKMKSELETLGKIQNNHDQIYGIDEEMDGAKFKIGQAQKTLRRVIGSRICDEVNNNK